MENKIIGIYGWLNTVTNKWYTGQSVDIWIRKRTHLNNLRKNKHSSIKFQRSFNKHGIENFKHYILELCPVYKLDEAEQFWQDNLDSYKNGYVCTPFVEAPGRGRIPSKETRKKMSNASSGEKNHFFGKTHTEEVKLFLSEIQKGISQSPKTEFKKGQVPHNKGISKFNSDEERKLNKYLSNKKYAEENLEKVAASKKKWKQNNKEKIKIYNKKYNDKQT